MTENERKFLCFLERAGVDCLSELYRFLVETKDIKLLQIYEYHYTNSVRDSEDWSTQVALNKEGL